MKPLFSEEEYKSAKTNDKLSCECEQCGNIFYIIKHEIQRVLNNTRTNVAKYCSKDCQFKGQNISVLVNCLNCKKEFYKQKHRVLKFPNNFCGQSCSATYNNKHKKFGIRRSKLEMYIESKLQLDYSNVLFLTNDKTTISSELDFYFSELKIAIELNGIAHYKPIYGQKKLDMIIANDKEKQKLCMEKNIKLYVINTSTLSYNCEKNYLPYYDMVKDIIKKASPN